MSGVGTVVQKEIMEFLWSNGRSTGHAVRLVSSTLFFGLMAIAFTFFSAKTGSSNVPPGLVDDNLVLAVSGIFMAATASVVGALMATPESVAGERDRHTLETLLATPLTDGQIIRGKMLAAALVGYGFMLGSGLVYVIGTVFLFMDPLATLAALIALIGGAIVMSLPIAMLVGLGTVVSIRARSMKAAQQTVGFLMLPVFFLMVAPTALATGLGSVFWSRGPILAMVALVTFVVTAIGLAVFFPWLAQRMFRRERLLSR